MAVIDLGHIKVTSELQPTNINLEDATQMELEERLYDRFHIDLSELQVLFCDSGNQNVPTFLDKITKKLRLSQENKIKQLTKLKKVQYNAQ